MCMCLEVGGSIFLPRGSPVFGGANEGRRKGEGEAGERKQRRERFSHLSVLVLVLGN